jgi:hypothetical protein
MAGAQAFSIWLSRSPPHALEVTGDLDNRENHDGRSGSDLGIGLTGCDGEIDERPREGGFFFSLSRHIFGMTEVTRKLAYACPSPLSNADRPRSVGTPVRWQRAVHREGIVKVEREFHFAFFEKWIYFYILHSRLQNYFCC